MSDPCPICRASLNYFTTVDGFDYFECTGCGSILIEPSILASIDAGRHLRSYDESYWSGELEAARHRAYGSSLARFAELILYARKPVRRFVDIAAGPGLLLESLATYLPASTDRFFAVEMFPPPEHTTNPNFYVAPLREIAGTFDAGVCIEVLEHLTPTMAAALAEDIATKSKPDSIYLFNTGMPQFVRSSDPGYLDPLNRGHIVSYSLDGVRRLFEPHGFVIHELRGKDWAFLAEYMPTQPSGPIVDRIWSPDPENKAMLHDPQMGSVLYCLGLESARAYAGT